MRSVQRRSQRYKNSADCSRDSFRMGVAVSEKIESICRQVYARYGDGRTEVLPVFEVE